MDRNEVIRLILSLLPHQSSDVDHLTTQIKSLQSAVDSLKESQVVVLRRLTTITSTVADLQSTTELLTSQVAGLSSRVASVTDEVVRVDSVTGSTITNPDNVRSEPPPLSSQVSSQTSTLTNLTSTVSSQSLAISDLQRRVTVLERSGGAPTQPEAPLQLQNGVVSLQASPPFCSLSPILSGPADAAVFKVGEWLGTVTSGQSQSSATMNVRIHSFGQRTMLPMSSQNAFTIPPGSGASLQLDVTRITTPAIDVAMVTPSAAFASASFMADIAFKDSKTGEVHASHTTGSFRSPSFSIAWVPVASETRNYQTMALRFTVATG
uniref:Cell attachment protein sigma C n=1 Tax=Duck reovirus TaxID=1171667 RepID=W0AYP9_9REOV|nr:cell attachment protein sigma C [Duck reovirus]